MGGVTNLTLSILMQATDNVSSVISAIGATLTNLLPGPLGTITAAFLGLGTVAVSAAQDFQSTMLQTQALAGVTGAQAQAATQAIMQMSIAVGQTPQQLAQGLYYIASASYNASDSLKLLQVSAQAAAIGNTSTEVTANALTAAMAAFNIPASQASTVMDQFVATVSNGKTEFADFAVSIGTIAVNARQAGVSITEAEAAFSTLTNVMPSAAQAKDSLDALLQTSSRFDVLTARAHKLGLEFNVNAYESMNLQQRLQYLQQITGGNELEMAKLLGRQNAVAAATVLMTNHFSTYDTVLGKIRGSQGALDTAFQQTSAGMQLAGARLNAAWTVLLVTLGTKFLPVLTALVNGITPLVGGLAQLIASGNLLGAMFTFVQQHALLIVPVFAGLTAAFIAWGVAIAADLLPMLAMLVTMALPGLISALAGLSVAAAPFVLIGATIALVVAGIILAIQHWGQIVAWFQGAWAAAMNGIKTALDSVFGAGTFQTIVTTVQTAWNSIVATALSVWHTVSSAIMSIVTPLVTWLQTAWTTVSTWIGHEWQYLSTLATVYWSALVVTIQARVQQVITWLQGAWTSVAPTLTSLWNTIVSIAKTIWTNVTTALQGPVTTAITWLKAEWTAIGPTLTAVWNTIVSTAQAVWGQLTTVFQVLGPVLAGVGTAFQNLWNTLQPLAALIASQFVLAWQQLVQLWQSVLLPILQQLWQVFQQQLWPILQQLWQLISSSLVVAFQQWWAVIQPLLPILGMIAGVIGGILLVALVSLIGILAGLIVAFANVLAGVIKIFTGIVQVISGAVQIIAGIITLFIDLVTGNFSKLGTDLGVIWQGIVTMFTGVWNIISGLFQATIGAIIGFVSTFITTLVTFFTNLYNTLVGHSIIPDLMTAMLAAFTSFVQAATALWQAWNTGTIALFTTFWQTVSNLFNTALAALVSFLQQTWTSISSTIQTVWNGIVSFFTSIGPKIISTIESPFQTAASAVISTITSMAASIGSIISGVLSKIGSITGAIHSIPPIPTGGSGGTSFGGTARVPGFASGIEHFTGGLAYVHQGEVLMNLAPGTSVIPARNVHAGGGGGTTHYNTFNVSVNAPALSRREASTLAEAVSRELASKYRTQLGSIAAGGSNV